MVDRSIQLYAVTLCGVIVAFYKFLRYRESAR